MRASEIQALKFNAVDFETGIITISSAYKRKTGKFEPYPKQKKNGYVPMVPELAALIRSLSLGKTQDDYVVSGITMPYFSYERFLKHLRKACAELGLPIVTPHELRHSCTELFIEQGAGEEDIIRLLNHSGASSVRRYIHRHSKRLASIAAKIEVAESGQTHLRIVR